MRRPIMIVPDHMLDEVFSDALEITQAMNYDAQGLNYIEERIKNFRKFNINLDVVIYDDLSIEFLILKPTERPN